MTDTQLNLPATRPDPEAVAFDVSRYRPSTGRPLVCVAQREASRYGLILPDARELMDCGVVADTAGIPDLTVGDVVLLAPGTGKSFTRSMLSFIPEGRELRQFGTAQGTTWRDGIIGVWNNHD